MRTVYTFGEFRFEVWSTGKVTIYTLRNGQWEMATSRHNPGFATFLRERAEIDVTGRG